MDWLSAVSEAMKTGNKETVRKVLLDLAVEVKRIAERFGNSRPEIHHAGVGDNVTIQVIGPDGRIKQKGSTR